VLTLKTVKTVGLGAPRLDTLLKQGVNEKRRLFSDFFTRQLLQESN
jgi:hypothetical protein